MQNRYLLQYHPTGHVRQYPQMRRPQLGVNRMPHRMAIHPQNRFPRQHLNSNIATVNNSSYNYKVLNNNRFPNNTPYNFRLPQLPPRPRQIIHTPIFVPNDGTLSPGTKQLLRWIACMFIITMSFWMME